MYLEARDTLMKTLKFWSFINAQSSARVPSRMCFCSKVKAGIVDLGRDCPLVFLSSTRQGLPVDMTLCGMLESLKVKVKPELKTQDESGAATPSPAKKLASDMEKKLKSIPGDTTLMKVWLGVSKKRAMCYIYIYTCRWSMHIIAYYSENYFAECSYQHLTCIYAQVSTSVVCIVHCCYDS